MWKVRLYSPVFSGFRRKKIWETMEVWKTIVKSWFGSEGWRKWKRKHTLKTSEVYYDDQCSERLSGVIHFIIHVIMQLWPTQKLSKMSSNLVEHLNDANDTTGRLGFVQRMNRKSKSGCVFPAGGCSFFWAKWIFQNCFSFSLPEHQHQPKKKKKDTNNYWGQNM